MNRLAHLGGAIGVALGLVIASTACSSTPPPPAPPSKYLTVASELDNRPFAWVDEQGIARGRDVEMMETLARGLGREVEWRRMPFADLLVAAEKGTVDVVCATIGITPERGTRVAFSEPYFVTGIAVVARAGSGEPHFLEELAGRRVLASPGTTSERALRMYAQRAVCVLGDDKDSTARDRLIARDVDAVVLDGPAADALASASNGTLVRLPGRLCEERYALVFAQDRAKLRADLGDGIRRMIASGEMEELDVKFGLRTPKRAR